MSTPIYKIWKSKPTAAWYALKDEETGDRLGQQTRLFNELGGKVILACRSFWSSERWPFFGVELFPDAEALQQHSEKLESLGWPKILDTETLLGVSDLPHTPVEGNPTGGIYKLFIGSYTAPGYQLDKNARDRFMGQLEAAMQKNGVKGILQGGIISSERYDFFGIEYYPNLDSVAAHRKYLNEMEWFQYIQADILLGVPWS